MSRLARAKQLRDQIRTVCADAGLPGVVVTVDPLEASSGFTHGAIVVVPPKLEFTTWDETTETWTLHVMAGPWDNYLVAWDTLDPIIDALRLGGINLANGEPTPIQVVQNEPPWPGYVLELTPDPIID